MVLFLFFLSLSVGSFVWGGGFGVFRYVFWSVWCCFLSLGVSLLLSMSGFLVGLRPFGVGAGLSPRGVVGLGVVTLLVWFLFSF